MSGRGRKPSIYQYMDYRSFLRDWLAFKKAGQSQFTLRGLCQEVGISLGYLSMVTKGKRNISKKALDKLNKAIKLDKNEFSHFQKLMVICDSDSPEERNESFKKLQRSNKSKSHHQQDLEAHEYVSNWYYVAIRELSHFPEFVEDAKWIQKRLKSKVSLKNIKNALEYLRGRNMLGEANTEPSTMNCTDGIYKLSLHQFHSQIFDLAKESISKTPRQKREIRGLTIGLTEEELESLRSDIDKLFKKYSKKENYSTKDEVYQIEMSAFPLSADLTQEDGNE